MTTPRDDIAGLSERLRERARELYGKARYRNDFDEAAAKLDALQARVKELEAEVEAMYTSLDANWTAHQRIVAAEARALRAEQERDEAYERLKPFAKDAAKCDSTCEDNKK